MRTSALFGAKNFAFFEIYGVFAKGEGGLSQCEHFADKREGVNFSRLTSLMDSSQA